MADDTQDESLKVLFQRAKFGQDALDTLDPPGAAFRTSLQSILDDLQRCRQLIRQLALFSANEEVEDIATPDLQYLTVDYTLADMTLKSYGNDRPSSLKASMQLFEDFLTRLDQYRMLLQADRRLYEQYLEQRTTFRIHLSSSAEEKRRVKIARFQEEKALKQKLEQLRRRVDEPTVDDESRRSLYLTEIALAVNQTFSSLDMIVQELDILSQQSQAAPSSQVPASPPDQRAPTRSAGYSERLDGPLSMNGLGTKGGALLSPTGKPLQPFTITDKRTQLRQGVFRPGHSLPTMTIDEYLNEERRRGGIIEGGGNAQASAREADEDDMAQVDAATMKAREWDEFVEANPKGAGNTLNRG